VSCVYDHDHFGKDFFSSHVTSWIYLRNAWLAGELKFFLCTWQYRYWTREEGGKIKDGHLPMSMFCSLYCYTYTARLHFTLTTCHVCMSQMLSAPKLTNKQFRSIRKGRQIIEKEGENKNRTSTPWSMAHNLHTSYSQLARTSVKQI